MRVNIDHPIFALCSGALPSAVAIIRVSGAGSFQILSKIFKKKSRQNLDFTVQKRGMWYGEIVGLNGLILDDVVILSFVEGASFTGQESFEIQCHGNTVIVSEIFELLVFYGVRAAERGEFSYRAFILGKKDLLELNNLADSFKVQTKDELNRIRSRKDLLSQKQLAEIRVGLLHLLAILETGIDFSEEYSAVSVQALATIQGLITQVERVIRRFQVFRTGNSRFQIGFYGAPNAGKSSLFNAIVGTSRSIVSEQAGTTRDVVHQEVYLADRLVTLLDVAGIREAVEPIEKEGVAKALDTLSNMDLILCLIDLSRPDFSTLYSDFLSTGLGGKKHILIGTKKDLYIDLTGFIPECLKVSVKTGEGLEKLVSVIESKILSDKRCEGENIPTFVEYTKVERLRRALLESYSIISQDQPIEFSVELIRREISLLSASIDDIENEEVLTKMFSEFCIGK